MKKIRTASMCICMGTLLLGMGIPAASAAIHEITFEATLTWDHENDPTSWNPGKLRDGAIGWAECDIGKWDYSGIHASWTSGNISYWEWDEKQVIDEVKLYVRNPNVVYPIPTGIQVLAMDGEGEYTISLYDSTSVTWEDDSIFGWTARSITVDGNGTFTKGISILYANSENTELGEVKIYGDVPEPTTTALLVMGMGGVFLRRRMR